MIIHSNYTTTIIRLACACTQWLSPHALKKISCKWKLHYHACVACMVTSMPSLTFIISLKSNPFACLYILGSCRRALGGNLLMKVIIWCILEQQSILWVKTEYWVIFKASLRNNGETVISHKKKTVRELSRKKNTLRDVKRLAALLLNCVVKECLCLRKWRVGRTI
jgi:hypothetical protein